MGDSVRVATPSGIFGTLFRDCRTACSAPGLPPMASRMASVCRSCVPSGILRRNSSACLPIVRLSSLVRSCVLVVAHDAISMAVAAVAMMLVAVPILFRMRLLVCSCFLFGVGGGRLPFADSFRGCKVMDYSVSCKLFRAVFPHPNSFKHLCNQ